MSLESRRWYQTQDLTSRGQPCSHTTCVPTRARDTDRLESHLGRSNPKEITMSDKLEAARSRLRAAVQERYDAGVAYDEAVR